MEYKNISRREFLSATLIGTGGIILGGLGGCKAPSVSSSPVNPFQTVTLGKTGIKTSLIGMGTGPHGWMRECDLTRQGREKSVAAIRYAFERGVRLFDCADLYGTHSYVAEAFKSIARDKYILTSKIWVRERGIPEKERPDADIVVDRFRKELGTEYIDLLLIHCMVDAGWGDQQKRQRDILADLKSKGIIRAHGVSVHSLDAMKACVDDPWVDSVHVRINAYGESMDDRDPAVVAPVIAELHKAGKGVVGMKLIGDGNFAKEPKKIDRSIEYVMKLGCVDSMIVGFERPEQIDDFARRVEKVLRAQQRA